MSKPQLKYAFSKSFVSAMLLCMLVLAVLGAFAAYQFSLVEQSTMESRIRWLQGTRNLSDAGDNLVEIRQLVSVHLASHDSAEQIDLEQAITAEQVQFRTAWAAYVETVRLLEERALYETFLNYHGQYEKNLPPLLALSNADQKEEARALFREKLDPAYNAAHTLLGQLNEFNWRTAESILDEAQMAFAVGWASLIVVIIGALSLFFTFVWHAHTQNQNISFRQSQDDWVKVETAKIIFAIQHIQSSTELARTLMSHITPVIGAQLGGIYRYLPNTGRYYLIGCHGYTGRAGLIQAFGEGEGPVGECIAQKAEVEIQQVSADEFSLVGDAVQHAPDHVLLLPLIHENEMLAVVEIASVGMLLPEAKMLVKAVLPMVAAHFSALAQPDAT